MDDLWSRFFGERPFAGRVEEEWSPSVDLSETKGNLVTKARLPVLYVMDINASISRNMPTIKGEKKRKRGCASAPKAEVAKKKEIEIKVK